MRRFAILPLIVLSVVVPASADHGASTWEQTGTILLANPTTRSYAGVTEQGSPCGGSIDPDVPDGSANGIDGFWFRLPDGVVGHDATLTSSEFPAPDPVGLVPGNDVDAWFYDDSCTLIRPTADRNAYHMATAGSNEFGIVPAGAAYVIVDLVSGGNATFTFRVLGVAA